MGLGRVSLPPPVCDTNLSQRLSFENNNNHREASFSSYLNHAEREFVRKLADSTRDNRPNSKDEHGDIEVFGAEKYFNGGIHSPNTIKLRPEQSQQMSTGFNKPKNGSSTPSVCSEASWNSQNALLQNVNRDCVSKGAKKKKKSSQLVKGLLYKFYCCDKKSVEVGQKQPQSPSPPPPPPPTKAGAGINFTFQSLIPEATKNAALKMQVQVGEQQERKSIEVFGSSLKGKPPSVDTVNLNNLEKKLSMMAWNDMVPRVKDFNPNSNSSLSTTNNNSNKIYDDDVESDTSSDLFEIENLNGDANAILTRQGSDCTGCYAPSEASIDWSVITVSAVDSSVVSDYNEWRLSTNSPGRSVSVAVAAAANVVKSSFGTESNEIQRSPSNLLMGCKNQKAVEVVGDKYDSLMEVHRRRESFGRLTRFEAETKITGFGPNQRLAILRHYSN